MAVEKARVSTGIKNLDKTIEGGFKKNSINLLEGGPGCGKSIFAMQFLVSGIKEYNETGIYITFEEEEESFLDNLSSFKWDLEKLVKDKKLTALSMKPEDVEKIVEKKSFDLKFNVVKKLKAKRIVVDSVSAYSLLFEDGSARRKALQELFKTLRSFECTSLLINEKETTIDNSTSNDIIDFEVDSIINLYNIRKANERERALEIRKIRGTKNTSKIFPMKITDSGIEIYPQETFF